MPARPVIAIELSPERMRALVAERGRDSILVHHAIVEAVPGDMDGDDPAVLGAWARGHLDAAGVGKPRATIALARRYVGLKRLTLPTTDPDELPEMARFALTRELPFDAGQAVIDFVVVERGESTTTVLAVAVPTDVVERARAAVRAAGLPIERVALRATGSSALLEAVTDPDACTLAVDVTGGGVEFCIVHDGAIRFSRAAAIDTDPEHGAAAVILTEARRTWMSYRMTEDAADVDRVIVMGPSAVAEEAAGNLGQMLSVEAGVLVHHPAVDAADVELDRMWPLAGLLLERVMGRSTIDFERPRRPVDHGERRRRRVLAVVAVIVLALLGAWTMANRSLRTGRTELARLEQRLSTLQPDYDRYRRDAMTLAHLRRWEEGGVRWLDHLLGLRDVMPPPQEVVLDAWAGTLDFPGVRYDRREKEWSVPRELLVVIEGEARDRRAADALRERLVESVRYEASSSGSDAPGGRRLPFGFTYRLRITEDQPVPAATAGTESAEAGPAAKGAGS